MYASILSSTEVVQYYNLKKLMSKVNVRYVFEGNIPANKVLGITLITGNFLTKT